MLLLTQSSEVQAGNTEYSNICWGKIDLHSAALQTCNISLSSSTPSVRESLSLDHPTYPWCLHSGSSPRFQNQRETSSKPALISQQCYSRKCSEKSSVSFLSAAKPLSLPYSHLQPQTAVPVSSDVGEMQQLILPLLPVRWKCQWLIAERVN